MGKNALILFLSLACIGLAMGGDDTPDYSNLTDGEAQTAILKRDALLAEGAAIIGQTAECAANAMDNFMTVNKEVVMGHLMRHMGPCCDSALMPILTPLMEKVNRENADIQALTRRGDNWAKAVRNLD